MNFGTRRASAAFRVGTLSKFADTRSADGCSSLLDFVAREVDRLAAASTGATAAGAASTATAAGAGPEAAAPGATATATTNSGKSSLPPPSSRGATMADEMPAVLDARLRAGLADTREGAAALSAAADRLAAELSRVPRPVHVSLTVSNDAVALAVELDALARALSEALVEARAVAAEVNALGEAAAAAWASLLSYFGETPASIPSDADFWASTAAFVERFSSAQRASAAARAAAVEREARLLRSASQRAGAAAAAAAAAGARRSALSPVDNLGKGGGGVAATQLHALSGTAAAAITADPLNPQ
jgi:hypothetical protein